MLELAEYIKTPLQVGEEVNILIDGINVIKCSVLRVEYNYHGFDNLHKILVKSCNILDNVEHDLITNQDYFGIVLQRIDE